MSRRKGEIPEDIFCPFCGFRATVTRYGYSSSGKRRYYCRWCKTSFVESSDAELTDRELTELNSLIDLELQLRLRHPSPDNRLQRRVASKRHLPFGEGDCFFKEDLVKAASKVLNISEEEAVEVLVKVCEELLKQ